MSQTRKWFVSAAVEGSVDAAVVRCLVEEVGGVTGTVYGQNGKENLLQRVPAYNQAANLSPWLVLVDLDYDNDCAPPFRQTYLPHPAKGMCFRIVVREIEAWLLADPERLARFLGVRISRIPANPEQLRDPKQVMVNLARVSQRRRIQEDIVPRVGSGRQVGPAYSSRLTEFVSDRKMGWRPSVAANNADSLNRTLRCLRSRIEQFGFLA